MNKIKFVANAVLWFDKVNGNTYHSVRITRTKDGKELVCPMEYGYGEQYQNTAIVAMAKADWIKPQYIELPYMYDRQNNYPIIWNVSNGLKRECIANGQA